MSRSRHGVYPLSKILGRLLNVYKDEIALFLWCALLLFLIRSSNILLNNYAETAFLKRFGVEYLPLVYMTNAVFTFFIMGAITGIMVRLPGARLLSFLLLFCGGSIAGLRFVVPLGFELLYPLLFILKSQYEVLLGLIFWNLANDLFNTRQSKRIFPLITAGGVLGGIIGSFGTPFLVKAISLDNLMLAYLGTTVAAASVVWGMGSRFPTLLISTQREGKKKSRSPVVDEFKKVLPMLRESRLVRILIFLVLFPNIVIPIMNYQFNFAVDQTFATEGGMIRFFGYFNGILNVISLIILLFIGRLYGRWGLPVALMFHPFNYLIAFAAFLFRFDVFSAMYARISTRVLRTTINNPARAVLVGLVPASYRSVVRPFLRGTVVRIGLLAGSGLIMLSERLVHPKYLSVAASLFVGGWLASTFLLKRGYSKILLDLISRNMLDLKSMEAQDVGHVFSDKAAQTQLVQNFLNSRGENCIWHAQLLKSLDAKDLDTHILSILEQQDHRTRIKLLELLSPDAGQPAMSVFRALADPEHPELMAALVKTANRFPVPVSSSFCCEILENTPYPDVKAYALIGCYRDRPQEYKGLIDTWLDSQEVSLCKAGVIAAGESGESAYLPVLKAMVQDGVSNAVLPFLFESLRKLGDETINDAALPYLNHDNVEIRLSALEAVHIQSDQELERIIALLDDPSARIRERAKLNIRDAPYQDPQLLVESLAAPRRRVREGIFQLLESLNIKDLDVYRFARSQIEKAYVYLAEVNGLDLLVKAPERDLLMDHLRGKTALLTENILRVLAAQDLSGEMRTIWRGLSSVDSRQRSNSLEALDDAMDPSLSKILIPLLEDLPAYQRLAVGKRAFDLPRFDESKGVLYAHLLNQQDWVAVVLTLRLLSTEYRNGFDLEISEKLADSDNEQIREMAHVLAQMKACDATKREETMEKSVSVTDKILHLRSINIFEGLSVGELAAVASVTEEANYPPEEVVIKEGDPGDTLFLIISGKVAVIKGYGTDQEIELDRIRAGDYFGEMALIEDTVRSATIRTLEESRLLSLHKREFTEIVREYPQIALHICKILGQRIRDLHVKIRGIQNSKLD
jgi:ATP/ADP translocase